MIRRPGMVVATAFALGAMLGLATSSVFLSVEAGEIRSFVETRTSAQSGPFADRLLDTLDESDVFGSVADDIRADQIRNLLVGAAMAAVISVGLGMAFRHRVPDEPTKRGSTTTESVSRRSTAALQRVDAGTPAGAPRRRPPDQGREQRQNTT